MKYLFYILLLSIFSVKISAQNSKMFIPKLDENLKSSKNIRAWMKLNCPGKYYYSECYDPKTKRSFVLKDSILKINEMIEIIDQGKKINYKLFYEYYPNQNLKIFKISAKLPEIHNEVDLGIWYHFKENGELFQTLNIDKPYQNTFLDVIEKAKKLNLNIKILRRAYNKNSTFWIIDSPYKFENLDGYLTTVLSDTDFSVLFEKNFREKEFHNRYAYLCEDECKESYEKFFDIIIN